MLWITKGWEELSRKDIEFLKSGVAFNLVTIAEGLPVRQLDNIIMEFRMHSFNIKHIIVNQVVKKPDSDFLWSKASCCNKVIYASSEII